MFFRIRVSLLVCDCSLHDSSGRLQRKAIVRIERLVANPTIQIAQHIALPTSTFAAPDARIDNGHIDIFGPLGHPHRYTCLLMRINGFTRFFEAIGIYTVTAESATRHFEERWPTLHGCLRAVMTDRGEQFYSDFFRLLRAYWV